MLRAAINAWLGPGIDQRHAEVHQQDGEGHAVRKAAPGADDDGEQAGAESENQLAARRGRTRYRIGGDEERPEHDRRRKQVEPGRAKASRVEEMQKAGGQPDAGQERQRHLPADDAQRPQQQPAQQERRCQPFEADAAVMAEYGTRHHFIDRQLLQQSRSQRIQRRGHGDGVERGLGKVAAKNDRMRFASG